MKFEIVSDYDRLSQLCETAARKSVVMVDTEFVRTRTLYPQLGLVQLFDGDNLALVDPIKCVNLDPLWDLMRNESVTKVLHACGEDLEVFLHVAGFMPTPMIDTQVMAAFLGHGVSMGFGNLVKEYLGIELEKGEARTNWLARPLTDKQLDYAAADVFYLLPLYECLKEKVEQAGWFEAMLTECVSVAGKRNKSRPTSEAYLDIKNAWQLTPRQLAILQKAAQWRVEEARKRDLALNFIVKEVNLWKLARYTIKSKGFMAKQGFEKMEIQRHGSRLIKMVLDVEKLRESELPPKIYRLVDLPGYKQQVKAIKDVVVEIESETGLAQEFLASKKQINQLIGWYRKYDQHPDKKPDMLLSWRQPLFEARVKPIIDEFN
ncbi:ribonuclease D [Thaumasiovibrio subtropicus]|uniref:ribonuclease D n=1 Tax=Thaumasiovibrio subtropicus TaxID=1891207 RepID=UPI000B354623|nr:ribonuclease D [Thaumasiovibrio subtropicus]